MKVLYSIGFLILFSLAAYSQPVADFIGEEVCAGDSTVLISTSTSDEPIISWKWDLDSDGRFDDAGGDTVKIVYEEHGYKNVGLQIVTENFNSTAIYNQVYVAENPFPNFNLKQPCTGVPTRFENITSIEQGSIESFYYTFGDDSNPSTEENPSHVYEEVGTYQVYMQTTTSFGCVNENYRTIEIRQGPELDLNVPPETSLGPGNILNLEVTSTFDSISWSTGENTALITVNTPGTYTVTVYDNGCPASQEIEVEGRNGGTPISGEYDIMTLITPNDDGFNDQWKINNITQRGPCEVSVYNRDGVLVFSSNDYQNDWEGTFNGEPLPEGSYYFVVECGTNEVSSGTLSILR